MTLKPSNMPNKTWDGDEERPDFEIQQYPNSIKTGKPKQVEGGLMLVEEIVDGEQNSTESHNASRN